MIPFGSKSVTLSMLIDLLTGRCRSTQVKIYTGLIASMGAVRIRHSIREFATQPVILWILLGGKPKWLPLNFGFNDVMRTAPIDL